MKFINFNSIRVKMGIFSTVILGGILILYSLYLYFELKESLYQNFDDELRVKAYELGKTIKAFQDTKSPGGDIQYAALKVLSFDVALEGEGPVTLADRQWFRLIDRHGLDEDYISILSLDGRVLASSENMPSELKGRLTELYAEHRRVHSTWDLITYEGEQNRVLQMMMFARDEPHYLIQIASPMTAVNQLLQERVRGIVISIPVVMIFFSLAGFVLSNQILRPVHKITQTAERLTHEDLSQRVEVSRVDSEMQFLVNAFNKMIQRLEISFKRMATLAAHIAHELKTPLAIIRGEGQTILRKPEQPSQEYCRVIESSITETERMLRVINDLLLIANISYDKDIFQFKPLKLNDFLRGIEEKGQILAEPKNIQMAVEYPKKNAVIFGDEIHLRRLFFNLIDNAIKYSYPGGKVKLSAGFESKGVKDETVVISVEDQGAGIAPEDLSYIFEHISEKIPLKGRNGRKSVGTGLGLHLCRAIAEAHNGKISVDSTPGKGSVFLVYLPLKG